MLELSTLSGLIAGLVILALAVILGGIPWTALVNPEAFLLVLGGTLTATLVSFNQATIQSAIIAGRQCLSQPYWTPAMAAEYVMEVAGFARQAGVLALHPMLESIELPFLRKGLTLVVDGRQEDFIRNSLTTDVEVTFREQMDHARVFETAGGFAPTMGIIAAVIGLMSVMQHLDDPKQLGDGVANAFTATLLGVGLANLFLLPLAGKLRQRARDEGFIKTLLMEAILSIARREHPLITEDKLCAFIGKDVQMSSMPGHRSESKRSEPQQTEPQYGGMAYPQHDTRLQNQDDPFIYL